jgi:hypothetical protein
MPIIISSVYYIFMPSVKVFMFEVSLNVSYQNLGLSIITYHQNFLLLICHVM